VAGYKYLISHYLAYYYTACSIDTVCDYTVIRAFLKLAGRCGLGFV